MRVKRKVVRRPADKKANLEASRHSVLKRIYASRGVQSEADLERELIALHAYDQLFGVEAAATLLAEMIATEQRILVVGDFDADGATSCALSVRSLHAFGAKHVDYLVPNRFDFGYGLTEEIVEVAKTFSPDLIMTVDNGIASFAGVLAAKAAGIKVLVTDHHLAADTLPEADVIVNPNQPADNFPSKNLAGVGVVFYVMLALRAELRRRDWFADKPEPNMANFLDIVALGTVADVVPLDKNNRILVHQGLRRIRAGRCVPGIKALLSVGKRQLKNVVASDMGFAVGPRLNAAGRMDDMSVGIECLLTDDAQVAKSMAEQLDTLNKERRTVEQTMQKQALDELKKIKLNLDNLPFGLSLYDPNWHQGVIGILAARIKDRIHRPVIVFAKANDTEIKGSARSIPGVHIRDVLARVDACHPGLILKFGGHAMAAGLSIPINAFKQFQAAFNDTLSQMVEKKDLEAKLETDGELTPPDFTLQFAEVLEEAGPWGQHFPEPVFDGRFRMIDQRLLSGNHLKLTLSPVKSDLLIEAIAFNVNPDEWPNHGCDIVHAVYSLGINEFRERRTLQMVIEQLDAVVVEAV
jgi:single-stranded-DNA-specific exonuclease